MSSVTWRWRSRLLPLQTGICCWTSVWRCAAAHSIARRSALHAHLIPLRAPRPHVSKPACVLHSLHTLLQGVQLRACAVAQRAGLLCCAQYSGCKLRLMILAACRLASPSSTLLVTAVTRSSNTQSSAARIRVFPLATARVFVQVSRANPRVCVPYWSHVSAWPAHLCAAASVGSI